VVLKAATVWATPGRVTLVLGRNGSGKSTLLRCALGMMRADEGIVRFFGNVYLRPRLWRFASRGLFYLPDRGLLSRRMRFGEQVGLFERRFGVKGGKEIAERVGAQGLLDVYPGQMSGGEERRCEISLAMTRRPRCLIADEPLAEIEPKDRWLVAEGLRDLAQNGSAVLLTGHEVEDLLEIADEVIWMTAGTTHGLGSAAEARAHGQFRREYLGPAFE
jgi:ABC-type multidrug transport system ATPase subunit